jgi:hypothetical protein
VHWALSEKTGIEATSADVRPPSRPSSPADSAARGEVDRLERPGATVAREPEPDGDSILMADPEATLSAWSTRKTREHVESAIGGATNR